MKYFFLSLAIASSHFLLMAQFTHIDTEVHMLALGDSYTIGESVQMQERWPHQLLAALRQLGVVGPDPDYIATTGWTTSALLGGIESMLEEDKKYNLVSVLIGVNNQYQGLPMEIYEPELRRILDKALEIVDKDTSRVLILSIPDYAYTPFGGGKEKISQEIDMYNAVKERVALEYGITYVDITPISRGGLEKPSLVASDGLHPSASQYARWAELVIPRLKIGETSTGAHKENPGLDIRLYPNPVSTSLQVDTTGDMRQLQILDAVGRIVSEKSAPTFPLSLDLGHLAPGKYTLLLYHSGEDRLSRKAFVKVSG